MVNEAGYDELDRYFTGKMRAEERVDFESRLSRDGSLKSELEWIANATAAMRNSGRAVMKQHIATILAGVPAEEIAKYTPSKNGVSFWKKWWWAVAIAVVIVSGAIVYLNSYSSDNGEMHFFDQSHDSEPAEQEHSITKDYLLDSCLDSVSAPMGDSTEPEGGGVKNQVIQEEVVVHYFDRPQNRQSKVKTPKPNNDRELEQMIVDAKVDTAQRPMIYAVGQGYDQPLEIAISNRQKPPYTYELRQKLILNANYYTTAGFKFNGAGDTVYMTDLNNQPFMLLKGRGELPLIPIKAVAK